MSPKRTQSQAINNQQVLRWRFSQPFKRELCNCRARPREPLAKTKRLNRPALLNEGLDDSLIVEITASQGVKIPWVSKGQ